MATCFVTSFASVYQSSSPLNPCPHQMCDSVIDEIVISCDDIYTLLLNLDPNTGMGADGIHSRLLKEIASEITVPLTIMYNNSLRTGSLPTEWLSSVVVPIYKKSFRYDPLNYRPISLTSVPCKVLEKAIVKHIYAYLEENNILSQQQFGFRSGHSTVEQLILTYNEITYLVDQGKTVDLLFFDYSKAFDVVCHHLLLQKLQCLGIEGDLLKWIEVFLMQRTMMVKVADKFSRSVPVTSGVPQGSVLGPLLFLIYINFAVSDITCSYKVFADDVKIYFVFDPDVPDSFIENQRNIDKLVEKGNSWGLFMNKQKCVVMRFSPKNSTLPYSGVSPYKVDDSYINFVESHSDLGIVIDRSLKFHNHIRRKTAMVGSLTTNLLSCTLSRKPEFIMNIYVMHVRPLLDYASQIWNLGYSCDLKLLEGLQRRWTRVISGMENVAYNDRLKLLDLFSLQGRLLRADMILLWKIFQGLSPIKPNMLFQAAPLASTRGHPFKIFLPQARLEVRKRFFSIRTIHCWNGLSCDTVCADSLNRFKALLVRDLGEELYKF